MRFPRWWLAATAVAALVATSGGFAVAWRQTTVDPARPAAVCPLLDAALLDRLVPGHDAPADERADASGAHAALCAVRRPDKQAFLDVTVIAFGMNHGRGPIALAHDEMAVLRPRPTRIDLADEATYWFDEPDRGEIHLNVRRGTQLVVVTYRIDARPAAAMLDAATEVARTVVVTL
jgi:hypothetical protein